MALPLNTEILETLGEGSFGAVYVALLCEGAIRRTVVLKVLKPEWSDHPEILVRSRDEATLLALLNHDNIVRVEQLIEIEGRPALVMEHVQGLTLERILKGNGPLPVGIAVGIAAKVASALDAAGFKRETVRGEHGRVIYDRFDRPQLSIKVDTMPENPNAIGDATHACVRLVTVQ